MKTLVFLLSISVCYCRTPHTQCAPTITRAWGPYLQQVTEPFEHGEEPTWDAEKQLLYFVDIHQGLVNSFNPKNKMVNGIKLDGDVTPVIPTRIPNRFVVGLNKTLVLLTWDGKTGGASNITEITSVDADKDGNRFNDGKADPKGRLWIGTMGYENSSGVIPDQASLYQFVRLGGSIKPYNKIPPTYPINVTVTKEISPVSISNGLAWSKDLTKFYYIDTPTRKVAVYDFDVEKGTISNRQVAFDLENYEIAGNPDGMTIDSEDNLYIALFGGGAVIKVNPKSGTLLQKIAIPAQQVTSVMFGGRSLDILFVTTSRFGLTPEQLSYQPAAGSVFAITNLGVVGRKMYNANF